MPADFEFPGERMAFFVPFDPSDTSWQTDARLALLGPLRPDVSLEAAQEDAAAIGQAIAGPLPADALPMDGQARFEVAERQGPRGAGTASGAPCVLRGRGRLAAHRLRQRRQSAAGARRRPSPGDGRAGGDGREPLANRARTAGGRAGADAAGRPRRRRARRAGRGARARAGDGRGARHLQPDVRRLHPAARAGARRRRAAVRHRLRRGGADRDPRHRAAGAARVARPADAGVRRARRRRKPRMRPASAARWSSRKWPWRRCC